MPVLLGGDPLGVVRRADDTPIANGFSHRDLVRGTMLAQQEELTT
jgi:hypothetical protein